MRRRPAAARAQATIASRMARRRSASTSGLDDVEPSSSSGTSHAVSPIVAPQPAMTSSPLPGPSSQRGRLDSWSVSAVTSGEEDRPPSSAPRTAQRRSASTAGLDDIEPSSSQYWTPPSKMRSPSPSRIVAPQPLMTSSPLPGPSSQRESWNVSAVTADEEDRPPSPNSPVVRRYRKRRAVPLPSPSSP